MALGLGLGLYIPQNVFPLQKITHSYYQIKYKMHANAYFLSNVPFLKPTLQSFAKEMVTSWLFHVSMYMMRKILTN